MKIKANYTVEAALICPLICLLVCGILFFTMELYYRVETYTVNVVSEEKKQVVSQLVRIEREAEQFLEEVE